MKTKCIEEKFPRWMKYGGWCGVNPERGDVSDVNFTIVDDIHSIPADKLVAARDAFVDRLIEIFNEHPEAFKCSQHTR